MAKAIISDSERKDKEIEKLREAVRFLAEQLDLTRDYTGWHNLNHQKIISILNDK